jgi:hypothetical protein
MQKKIAVFALAASLLALTACGNTNSSVASSVVPSVTSSESSAATTSKGTSATTTSAGTTSTTSAGTTSAGTTSAGTTSAGTTSAGTTSAGTTSTTSIPSTPEPVVATIEDILALTASDTTKLYQVSGVLEGLSHTDEYGNCYLTDPANGKTVTVYGLTGSGSALSYTSPDFTFTNPKDAVTSLADYSNGEVVTIQALFTLFDRVTPAKPELSGVAISHVASTSTYAASFTANENAEIALSKTTGIAYGETVVASVTPKTGYKVDKVTVADAHGGFTDVAAEAADATKFDFAATCVNVVAVTVVPDVSYTKLATYAIANSSASTSVLTTATAKTLLASSAATTDGQTDIISAVATATNVYGKYTGYEKLGLKFGTSSGAGTLTLTLSKSVSKVVLDATGWTATDTISVGDATAQCPGVAYKTAGSTKTLSFVFTAGTSVTIATANRVFINNIVFYTVAA